jgi:lysophospholipase L1-like esterase
MFFGGSASAARILGVNEALADAQGEPGLSRVLLLGDSISMGVGSSGSYQGYEAPTQNLLKGIANVRGISGDGGNTRFGLLNLRKWLGKEPWDVIHFNWGLHDIVRKPDGQCIVPADEYERNLREIVKRLKATGATLIWATTTPVPEKEANKAANRRDSDVIAYNSIGRRIMEEHHIAVDDLYSFALPRLKEIQQPEDVHFTFEGSAVLAKPVADSILAALKQRGRIPL